MKTSLPITRRQPTWNLIRSLGAGTLMLLAGCASFDTTYTDPTETELSLWGGMTRHEYSGPASFGPVWFPSQHVNRGELEQSLRRKVESFPMSAPSSRGFPR